MLRTFLLLPLLLVHTTYCWIVTTTHSKIDIALTENVTICCHYDNDDNGKSHLEDVLRIQIHRLTGNRSRAVYAEVRDGGRDPVLHEDDEASWVFVEGFANEVNDSFLSVKWSEFPHEIAGQYKCEVNGYDADGRYTTVFTDPVSIARVPISPKSLLETMRHFMENTKHAHKDAGWFKAGVHKEMTNITSDVEALKEAVSRAESRLDRVVSLVDSKVREVVSLVNSKVEEVVSLVDSKARDGCLCTPKKWPGGKYALLDTVHGCPTTAVSEGAGWQDGYIKFHTESSDLSVSNGNEVSSPNHLARPIFDEGGDDKFFYIRTCKCEDNSTTTATRPSWPKGSYCVHRVGGACPVGFSEGTVKLDPEDDPKVETEHANAPDFWVDSTLAQYLYLAFCCRNDGDPDQAIGLPVESPFYLYRYKGRCQKVLDATVKEEWFLMDTEDSANGDEFPNGSESVPDSSLNPANFTLCYYHHEHH